MADIFGKLACGLAFHDWKWIQNNPGGCEEVRTCMRCGAVSERRQNHNYDDWVYVQPGLCAQVRTCSRCGQQESKTEHDLVEVGARHEVTMSVPGLGDLRYVAVKTRCKRCGKTEETLLGAA